MFNKCIEPLTAIGCALGAPVIGAPAGAAMVGGAALMSRFLQAVEKHGLDNEMLITSMRMRVIRAWDKVDQTEAERDVIGAADSLMGQHIADCLPTREELAATALKANDVYPAEAARLVVDRLAERDEACRALFSAPPEGEEVGYARDFALTVVEAALRHAKNDPAYAPLLTLDLVIEVAGGVGRLERDMAEVLAILRGKGNDLPDQALRGTIARFVKFRPDASQTEIVEAVERFEIEYRELLAQVRRVSTVDNHIGSLKGEAEAALEAGDLEAARRHYAEAIAVAKDKATEPVRNVASLLDADAATALAELNWDEADRAWDEAAAMLTAFDLATSEAIRWNAAHSLEEFGRIFGVAGALDAAISRWQSLADASALRGDLTRGASIQNNLASALAMQGERTGGAEGLALLACAVASYEEALLVRTREAMPTDWAGTQNNLGNALQTQAARTGGAEGLALLGRAVTAYEDALSVCTRDAMPVQWARTLNNLGNVLQTQGERTGGAEGLALLARAVTAYEEALSIRTREAMPADWAGTQNNLANTLSAQGERTGGAEGLALLARAVAAYEEALSIRTRETMPVDWAMTQNNLGIALRNQGERTGGAEGLALLARAVASYEEALRVFTLEAMPADWAMTRENMAICHLTIAERSDDPLPELRLADVAVVDALNVFTPEHMPYDHGTATRLLTDIRECIAAAGG